MRRKTVRKLVCWEMVRESGIQVVTILGDNKAQGMIIGASDCSETEADFVGAETDEDL